jgi:hypothetical protein
MMKSPFSIVALGTKYKQIGGYIMPALDTFKVGRSLEDLILIDSEFADKKDELYLFISYTKSWWSTIEHNLS